MLNKEVLKQKLLSSLTPIHLLLDAWSSPNRKTFIAICGYFVNDTGVLRKVLEDKEAVDAAFKDAREKLEAESDLENNQIEELLAKRFKKGKASKFTYREIGPLGKVYNVVVHIRSSNARYNGFVATALRALPMDNDTRWNSWYDMILVALKLKDAITNFQEQFVEEFDEEDILNAADWRALENIRDFLQPFQRVTKETEGDKATLDKVTHQ